MKYIRDWSLWVTLLLAICAGAAVTAATFALATRQDPLTTVSFAVLATVLAAAQIYIMIRQTTLMSEQKALAQRQSALMVRQTDIAAGQTELMRAQTTLAAEQMTLMTRQDDILMRTTALKVFGHITCPADDLSQLEADSGVSEGSFSLTSVQVYIINEGKKTASGFSLSLRVNAGPFVHESDPWAFYTTGPHVIFTFKSRNSIFPDDIEVLKVLDIVTPDSQAPPEIENVFVRIACEDGASGWIQIGTYAELPQEFKQRLF